MDVDRSFQFTEMPASPPPIIRKDFPETWLWDMFSDRCVQCFMKANNCYAIRLQCFNVKPACDNVVRKVICLLINHY